MASTLTSQTKLTTNSGVILRRHDDGPVVAVVALPMRYAFWSFRRTHSATLPRMPHGVY
jgi:hypothetical protein